MKKAMILLISLIFMISSVIFIVNILDNYSLDQNDSIASDPLKVYSNEGNELGYYYFGFIDIRDRFEPVDEYTYFLNMDNYFEDYYKDMFILSKKDEESSSESYFDYFEGINGLNLLEIPKSKREGLRNGDYISISLKEPTKETFPLQNQTINNIIVLSSRIP